MTKRGIFCSHGSVDVSYVAIFSMLPKYMTVINRGPMAQTPPPAVWCIDTARVRVEMDGWAARWADRTGVCWNSRL